jgi:hypothetical protein
MACVVMVGISTKLVKLLWVRSKVERLRRPAGEMDVFPLTFADHIDAESGWGRAECFTGSIEGIVDFREDSVAPVIGGLAVQDRFQRATVETMICRRRARFVEEGEHELDGFDEGI